MATSGAWASLWRITTRFERGKVQTWVAARNALGIAIPLTLGAFIGSAPAALTATIGALNVSFTDGSDPYLLRVQRMLAASALTASAVVLGGLCANYPALALLVPVFWAAGAGLLVSLDQAAADIGTISLVTLLIFTGQAMTPSHAVYAGSLALAGALIQTALAVALWPVRRYEPERRVLAALYREISRIAHSNLWATAAPPATAEATQAQQLLTSLWRTRSTQGARYLSLLNQAERVRLELMVLGRLRNRLSRDAQYLDLAPLDQAIAAAARILDSAAGSIERGTTATADPDDLTTLQAVASDLPQDPQLEEVRHSLRALAGQLRAIIDLTTSSSPLGRELFEQRESGRPLALRLSSAFSILRANLNRRSVAFQHALRLSLAIAAGQAIAHSVDLERAYWIPLTIAIILKPDFSSTFSRGILRLTGTLIGLGFATAIIALLPLNIWIDVLLITAFSFLLRGYGPANYGIMVFAISAMVVFMFATVGIAPEAVILERAVDTLLGGVIALVAYGAWPTWERSQVSRTFAALFDAYREYFRVVARAYAEPDRSFARELGRARHEARLARSNAEASADRLHAEPGVSPQDLSRAAAILASSHRLIHAIMALEAGLSRSRPVPARPAFLSFANHVEITLHSLASFLRGSPAPDRLPDLRAEHQALLHSGDPSTERYALVNVETDRITNSVNTLARNILDTGNPEGASRT